MKLKMSLPERPGWIFVVPGFDFVALLLALVMLTGVVAREGLVEVKLPPSEFRSKRLGDENPVIVILQKTEEGSVYYVGRDRVAKEALAEAISAAVEELGTRMVAISADERSSVKKQHELINLITGLGFRVGFLVRDEASQLEGAE